MNVFITDSGQVWKSYGLWALLVNTSRSTKTHVHVQGSSEGRISSGARLFQAAFAPVFGKLSRSP